MKNILFITLFLSFAINLRAQENIRLAPEVGTILKNNEVGNSFFGKFTATYQTGKTLEFGIGIGFFPMKNIKTKSAYNIGSEQYQNTSKDNDYVPIYARIKLNLTKKPWIPFLKVDLGYNAPFGGDNKISGLKGLYFNPSIGLQYYFNKSNAIYLSSGITVLKLTQKYNASYSGMTKKVDNSYYVSLFSTAIGYRF